MYRGVSWGALGAVPRFIEGAPKKERERKEKRKKKGKERGKEERKEGEKKGKDR